MTQQAYKRSLDVGVAGSLSAVGGELRSVPLVCSADVTPGTALSFDANGLVTPVGGASLAFAGIALNTHLGNADGTDTYREGDLVPVADRVSVWCTLSGGTAAAIGGCGFPQLRYWCYSGCRNWRCSNP